jgi:hypothetical protein
MARRPASGLVAQNLVVGFKRGPQNATGLVRRLILRHPQPGGSRMGNPGQGFKEVEISQ